MDRQDPDADACQALTRLLVLMRRLRDPARGCPWDRAQSFDSIAPYTIEEAYEVADAIARRNLPDLRDELGDLLFQVVFHARMAEEDGVFAFADVARAITDKMVRRHPDLFAAPRAPGPGLEAPGFEAPGSEAPGREAPKGWEAQKQAERRARAEHATLAGIPVGLPALTRALKLSQRAARVGFDWPTPALVLDKLLEEAAELRAELPADPADPARTARLADELGDLLFVLANLARILGLDPEACLRGANAKFTRRFEAVETRLAAQGLAPADASLAAMEAEWQAVKQAERAAESDVQERRPDR